MLLRRRVFTFNRDNTFRLWGVARRTKCVHIFSIILPLSCGLVKQTQGPNHLTRLAYLHPSPTLYIRLYKWCRTHAQTPARLHMFTTPHIYPDSHPHDVIGSTVGARPGGTCSSPVERNGHFLPWWCQLHLSPFSNKLRPTQRRSLQMPDVAVSQIGVGVFHAWFWLTTELAGERLKCLFRLTRSVPPSLCNRKHGGRVSRRYRLEYRQGKWALFSLVPSSPAFIFLCHTHTHSHTHTYTRTHARAHTHTHTHKDTHTQTHTHTHTQAHTYTPMHTYTHAHIVALTWNRPTLQINRICVVR